MYISDNELECSRLPMGHMCQEIPGRPSFRGDRHLLLLITQLVDESLKTRVILLEGIQNTLLYWSFCGQIVYSSLCFLPCYRPSQAITSITLPYKGGKHKVK